MFILIAVYLVLAVSCGKEDTEETKDSVVLEISTEEKEENIAPETKYENAYDQVMYLINEGDIEMLFVTLLEDDVTNEIYEQFSQEDKEIFEIVMRDVLLYCEEFNDAETIVRLRVKGFVSDETFEHYWLALGYNPEKNDDLKEIDKYLLAELERFMKKETNDGNFLKELYGLGVLDETFQNELEKRLQ